MSTQNNPIIFVTLGQGSNIWQHLSLDLQGYNIHVAYINSPTNISDSWAKNEIGRIWKNFLHEGQITADIVRVNYIIGTDEPGLMLPAVRQYLEKYLAALYPAGVLVDIYALLDDDRILENNDSRKAIITMLQNEQKEGVMVYLLSNLTSQNMLITDTAIAHSIAMLSLFKDCSPELYVTGADASRYNELYFSDNCYKNRGQFLTASSLNVAIPQDGLRALLMQELLTLGRDDPYEIDNIFDESFYLTSHIKQNTTKPIEYFLGMAIPEAGPTDELTHKQWIKRLFGNRLTTIDIQKEQDDESVDFTLPIANLYDLFRQTGEDGIVKSHINEAVAIAEENLRIHEEKFDQWLTTTPNFTPKMETRRLSPFINQSLWPYKIASGYVHRQCKLHAIRMQIDMLKKKWELVSAAHQNLRTYLEIVNTTVERYEQAVEILNINFAPFAPSATDYFRSLFREYANSNPTELLMLSKEMTRALLQEDLPSYLIQLNEYIDSNILTSELFTKPMMDTLRAIASTSERNDISVALGDWVFNQRKWNIRLKTGYANLHTEINIFMPIQDAADVKHRYEERGLGRMNLFTDENANRVSVLYHAGAFNLEDLYYEGLYSDTEAGASE